MSKEGKKDLTEQEILEQARKITKDREAKFIKEYKDLCAKYGLEIQGYVGIKTVKLK